VATPPNFDDVEILSLVLPAFKKLDDEQRLRLLQTIATFFGIKMQVTGSPKPMEVGFDFAKIFPQHKRESTKPSDAGNTGSKFSEDKSISPKDFMMQKQPRTDVERVACLAFYLTHYREVRYFKTLDLSKLNTEAAQPKFSNAAKAVENAILLGYLVPASKGDRQLSARGEQFVLALPDREEAKKAMAAHRRRPQRRAQRGIKRA
jgi:hypothetical protein